MHRKPSQSNLRRVLVPTEKGILKKNCWLDFGKRTFQHGHIIFCERLPKEENNCRCVLLFVKGDAFRQNSECNL